MTLLLQRSYEISDVEGRTLLGRTLTYNRPYRVSDNGKSFYREGWRPGSLAEHISQSGNAYELRARHADVRVGLVSFDDDDSELRFRAVIDGTNAGDAAIADVESGRLDRVSLCYWPQRQKRGDDGVLWRTRAGVRELSLAPLGQYEDAEVLVRRERDLRESVLEEIDGTLRMGDRLLAELGL